MTLTINVLLRKLDVVSDEVGQLVVQVAQQLESVLYEDDCVVFTKQHPLVAVQVNRCISQKRRHCRPVSMHKGCEPARHAEHCTC